MHFWQAEPHFWGAACPEFARKAAPGAALEAEGVKGTCRPRQVSLSDLMWIFRGCHAHTER